MLRPRIIPCLLMSGGGLVKPRQFKTPKYVGDPLNAVKIFNEKEVDELILLEIGGKGRDTNADPDYRLLEKVAGESRMPLCYGGGIKSVDQARRIINLGFEKVSVSSAALARPDLVSELAQAVGSQSTVVTLDVQEERKGEYSVYTRNGTQRAGLDLFAACRRMVEMGAGELVINSINREGEMSGYDLPLARQVARQYSVPLTFIGGAGNTGHMKELIDAVGCVGVGAGSMFVFRGPLRAVLINYSRP